MYHTFKSQVGLYLHGIYFRLQQRKLRFSVFFVFLQKFYLIFSISTFSLGSVCSHVAALLCKLEACTRLQLNKVAVTSKLYQWNRSMKSAKPDIFEIFNFKRPKKKDFPQQNTKNTQAGNYLSKIVNQV